MSLFIASCGGVEDIDREVTKDTVDSEQIEGSGRINSSRIEHSESRTRCADYSPNRKPLFGDLHVHTALSFDAVAGRINIMPEDALNFARGKPIAFFPQNEEGEPIGEAKIDRPLDFLAVTDHSEYLGERAEIIFSKQCC